MLCSRLDRVRAKLLCLVPACIVINVLVWISFVLCVVSMLSTVLGITIVTTLFPFLWIVMCLDLCLLICTCCVVNLALLYVFICMYVS